VKRLAVVALVIGCGASTGWGGVVTFGTTELEVGLEDRGPREVAVTINPTAPSFDGAVVLIGSRDVPITGFTLLPAWGAAFTAIEGPFLPPSTPGFYTYEAYFGGNTQQLVNQDSITAGMLTVDLSSLAEGTYMVGVDSAFEAPLNGGFPLSGIGNRGATELLSGALTIKITPEPATLSLLGLGLLAAIRRRRTA